jgi:putative membrane protein
MRAAILALGIVVLGAVWLGPLPLLMPGPFSAHMAMHMGVVAVAAPLIALGLAGGRLDPALRQPALFAAIPASLLEFLVVWAWHAPALHHVARHSALGFALEQATFLASGLFVWMSSVGGDPRDGARAGAGVLALLLTSMHMTLLGALLALPPRALYAHGGHGMISPLADQHLGGAIMLLVGGVAYLGGGLGLVLRFLRRARVEVA